MLSITLLLVGSVSAVVSTLLRSLRRAAGAPEFLIFNDTVNGCEFLGKETGREAMGGRFVEQHGGSGKPPELDCDVKQRTLCGSLDSAGLLQWLVFAAATEEIPIIPPSPLTSRIE